MEDLVIHMMFVSLAVQNLLCIFVFLLPDNACPLGTISALV